MSGFSTTKLIMVREFDVPTEQVFDAWLNPEEMKKWLFTLENTNKLTQNDPQVGGSWEIIDHRGGIDYRAVGEYLEIKPTSKIVFTFKMPELQPEGFKDLADTLTIEFEEIAEGTKMTLTHLINVIHEDDWTKDDIETAHQSWKDGMEQGFDPIFMGLKELLETGKVSYKG